MSKALTIHVKESVNKLNALLTRHPSTFHLRIKMLLIIKKSRIPLSKLELAQQVGVNHNTIQKWRNTYITGGLTALLKNTQGGKRREVITASLHRIIRKRLLDPHQPFKGYQELKKWLDANYTTDIKYVTLNAYIKKHLSVELEQAQKMNRLGLFRRHKSL